jgi:AraC-like DNA-binding protein
MRGSLLLLSVDIASIVACALFGARTLARHPRLLSAQLIALISFDTICHIILSRAEYGHWIQEPYRFNVGGFATILNFARNLTPGLFMILCATMFADRQRFPRALLALFFIEMLLEVPLRSWLDEGLIRDVATRITPAVLQAVFTGFALYWSIASWRADLIEGRRRARILILVIIGLNIIGSTLFLRVLIPQNSLANYETHLALTLSNLPIVLFILIFLSDDSLREPLRVGTASVAVTPRAGVSSEVAGILSRLASLMEVDRIYRRPSLSVKELAARVKVPEYRLRKVIHEQLGHPNFNAFLHQYRIREACQQLRDPQMRRIPILTIALSTGYQSVNTFNRAFREIMDMPPSVYRSLDDAAPLPGLREISPETS